MARALRVGVVGTGRIAPDHVVAARRAGAEVVAIAGSDAGRAKAFADRFGIPDAMGVDELLGSGAIDAVHVAGRNVDNVRTAEWALDRGLHLVLEKPVGLTSVDAARLVRAAKRSGTETMTCFTYLGTAGVRLARRRVVDGSVGAIAGFRAHYLQDWMRFETAPDWRMEPAIAGPGGALSDIGTHFFSVVEYVSGERVTAVSCRVPASSSPPLAATMMVELSNGVVGSVAISQEALGHDNDLRVEFDGEIESIAWSAGLPAELVVVTAGATGPDRTVVAGEDDDRLAVLLRRFYAAAGSGQPGADHPSLEFGARATMFVDAALESAAAQSWVTLPGL